MGKIRVGICLERDPSLGLAMAYGLGMSSKEMEFICFDGFDSGFDMYITDNEALEQRFSERTVFIRDGEYMGKPIRRSQILELLNALWYQLHGEAADYHGCSSVRTVGFCSLAGGSGTTSCAIACAKMLNEMYGHRVLYLNVSSFDNSENYLKQQGVMDFKRLLYELRQGRHPPINTYLNEDQGLYCLASGFDAPFFDFSHDLFRLFLEELGSQDVCTYVVVDAGCNLTPGCRRLLRQFDRCLVIEKAQEDSPTKFQREARDWILKELPGAETVRNLESAGSSGSDCRGFSLPCCPSAFVHMGGYWKISLRGEYGVEIGAIARWIEEGGADGNWGDSEAGEGEESGGAQ